MTTTADITLDTPLTRGETTINQITLHKPNAGNLRGISLRAILDIETDAILNLVPRISDPKITPAEMNTLAPADLLQLGAAMAGFFVPSAAMEQARQDAAALSQTA